MPDLLLEHYFISAQKWRGHVFVWVNYGDYGLAKGTLARVHGRCVYYTVTTGLKVSAYYLTRIDC